ncbi:unnamed protein product [Prunus brigantina]
MFGGWLGIPVLGKTLVSLNQKGFLGQALTGKRSCIGLPLVHRTGHFHLAALLHAFEWEFPADILDIVEERMGLAIQKGKDSHWPS